jgi:hypothetical protein
MFCFIVFFIVSSAWLAVREHQLDSPKNWWSVSLLNPDSSRMDIQIENFTDMESFSYSILEDSETVEEGMISVETNKTFVLQVDKEKYNRANGVRITVRDEKGDTREIFLQ